MEQYQPKLSRPGKSIQTNVYKDYFMPLLSKYAWKRKVEYFPKRITKQAKILKTGWVSDFLKEKGRNPYVGIDVVHPADIVGDIPNWKELGLKEKSFDVIVAFEVVEHVDCFKECFELLKPGGMLMLTSPVPHMYWLLKLLEVFGLNQKRTSPHNRLVYFRNVRYFQHKDVKIIGFLSQWGIFTRER